MQMPGVIRWIGILAESAADGDIMIYDGRLVRQPWRSVAMVTVREGNMKKFVLVLALQMLAVPAFAGDFSNPDKLSHLATGALWGGVADSVVYRHSKTMGPVERTLTATGIGTIPGLVVEIGDEFSSGNRFSWSDLLADGVGALAGAFTAELINGQLWLSASGKQIRLVGTW